MKKTRLRIMALVAATAILCAITGGCKSGTGSGDKVNVANTKISESLKASALKYEWDDGLDLGGKELTISTWGSVPERDASEYFERRYLRSDRTEEKYHVTLKWLPVPDTSEKFIQDVTLAFTAGKKYADIMFCPSFFGFELAKLGAIRPLDDYIDYGSPYYALNGDLLKYVDGKHYSYFPDEFSPSSYGFGVVYNQTLTEAVLDPSEDPMTLYKQGKWDWDAFENVVKKTTKLDSSGQVVQYGVGGGWLLDALCLSNGISPIDIQGNEFVCQLYSDAGLNVLNFIHHLAYDIKGVDSSYMQNSFKNSFNKNQMAMAIAPNWPPQESIRNGMSIVSVPLPKGPDANGQVIGMEFQEWWTVSSISDFTVEELLQVALDMNENDPAYEDTYQTPEVMKEKWISRMYEGCAFATEEEAELFYDLLTDPTVEKKLDYTISGLRYNLFNNIQLPLYSGDDPRTVLERYRPVIDNSLEYMLPDSLKK